jgi:hypothetical protein
MDFRMVSHKGLKQKDPHHFQDALFLLLLVLSFLPPLQVASGTIRQGPHADQEASIAL